MSPLLADVVWLALGAYAAPGLLVALWLLGGGLTRFDAGAASAPWFVKALWLPGLVALWPLMLRRAAGVRPREDRA